MVGRATRARAAAVTTHGTQKNVNPPLARRRADLLEFNPTRARWEAPIPSGTPSILESPITAPGQLWNSSTNNSNHISAPRRGSQLWKGKGGKFTLAVRRRNLKIGFLLETSGGNCRRPRRVTSSFPDPKAATLSARSGLKTFKYDGNWANHDAAVG